MSILFGKKNTLAYPNPGRVEWTGQMLMLSQTFKLGKPMRMFLRSTRTGRYFGRAQEWTDDSNDALNFSEIENAISTACRKRLQEVEVAPWEIPIGKGWSCAW